MGGGWWDERMSEADDKLMKGGQNKSADLYTEPTTPLTSIAHPHPLTLAVSRNAFREGRRVGSSSPGSGISVPLNIGRGKWVDYAESL